MTTAKQSTRTVPVEALRCLDVPALAGLLHTYVDKRWAMFDEFAIGPCVDRLCAASTGERDPAAFAYSATTGWEPWIGCQRCGGVDRVYDLLVAAVGEGDAFSLVDPGPLTPPAAPVATSPIGFLARATRDLERAFPRTVLRCADLRQRPVRTPVLLPAVVLNASRRRSHAGEAMVALEFGAVGVGECARVTRFFNASAIGLLNKTVDVLEPGHRVRSLEDAPLGLRLIGSSTCLAAVRVVDTVWGPRTEIDHVRPHGTAGAEGMFDFAKDTLDLWVYAMLQE